MIKIASWNVNSLPVRLEQVLAWCDENDIDICALQETKVIDANFPQLALKKQNYHAVFSGQKMFNGVAIISRLPATAVMTDMPMFCDPARRIIAATIGGVRVINIYVPNGAAIDSDKYSYKLAWLSAVTSFIQDQLSHFNQLVVLGDFNIAPEDRDVYNPVVWQNKILVSPLERQAFKSLLCQGLHDSFRLFYQAEKSFSWWDYRALGFRLNHGLRIDHILLSDALSQQCHSSQIDTKPRKSVRPSDHAPVWVELKI